MQRTYEQPLSYDLIYVHKWYIVISPISHRQSASELLSLLYVHLARVCFPRLPLVFVFEEISWGPFRSLYIACCSSNGRLGTQMGCWGFLCVSSLSDPVHQLIFPTRRPRAVPNGPIPPQHRAGAEPHSRQHQLRLPSRI
jgi:hypothetical protein